MAQHQLDPVINEIREVRHRISARFGHNPKRLIEYYMQLQEQHKDRLLHDVKADGLQVPGAERK